MKISAVQTFKKLFASIHSDLPVDSRESQRLLNLLKTKFRKQLDETHPPRDAAVNKTLEPIHPTKTYPRVQPSTGATSSSHVAMSRHVQAILANPLLGDAILPRAPGHPAVLRFQELVANGSASTAAAERCLRSVLSEWPKVSGVSRAAAKEQIRSAQAGSEVLSWIESSGQIQSEAFRFKEERRLIKLLALCLTAEEQLDAFASHINVPRLFDTNLTSTEAAKATGNVAWRLGLVWRFTQAMQGFKEPFSKISSYFLRLLDEHTQLARSPHLEPEAHLWSQQAFRLAGDRLVEIWTNALKKPRLPVEQYDKLIEKAPQWAKCPHEVVAMLHVHHPTKPDSSYALEYLRRQGHAMEEDGGLHNKNQSVLTLCFDAADLLMKQGDFETSAWVLEYAEKINPGASNSKKSVLEATRAMTRSNADNSPTAEPRSEQPRAILYH